MKKASLFGLMSGVVLLSACGYALVGRSTNIPEDIQKVYVETLRNETTRSQVDLILTNAIAQELVTRRRFEVVANRSDADAELVGAVNQFVVRPVTFGGAGRAREYEILIIGEMEFRRVGSDDVIWSQSRYQFRENYALEDTAAEFFDREDLAITEVADKFAETLVIDLMEGF